MPTSASLPLFALHSMLFSYFEYYSFDQGLSTRLLSLLRESLTLACFILGFIICCMAFLFLDLSRLNLMAMTISL